MYVTTADHLTRTLSARLLDLLQQGRRFPLSQDEGRSVVVLGYLSGIGLRLFRDREQELWVELGEGVSSVRQRCSYPSDTEGEHDHDACTSALVERLEELLTEPILAPAEECAHERSLSTASMDAAAIERVARKLGGGHEGLSLSWNGHHRYWAAAISTARPRHRPAGGRWAAGRGETPEAALRALRVVLRRIGDERGVAL